MSNTPIPVPSTVASLASVGQHETGSLVRPAAPTDQIEQAFRDYTELCNRLIAPSDMQRIGSKDFRKKSAWRKLAVAFGVSCEITDRIYERDGGKIIRAEVVIRATAPNGRYMDGLGACDLFERCCVPGCTRGHTHCPAQQNQHCPGANHFSNPSHDLPATAATRATNRACADLFGMGEISAEEITNPDRAHHEEPVDPNTFFIEAGWPGQAEHDTFRENVVAVLRSAPDDAKAEFKAWREDEGIELTRIWTRKEAEAINDRLILMGLTERPPEPDSQPNQAPEVQTPTKAPTAAPGPDDPEYLCGQCSAVLTPQEALLPPPAGEVDPWCGDCISSQAAAPTG